LMRACGGRVALKGGADGAYVAILPEQRLGIALKIVDGGERAKEAAIAAVLIKLGVLDPAHPAAVRRVNTVMKNWRGVVVGSVKPAAALA
jgi:L-asparaginase II